MVTKQAMAIAEYIKAKYTMMVTQRAGRNMPVVVKINPNGNFTINRKLC
jgi:dihydroxyacid dehydratase/phosphogluconate dehydratase